MLNVRFKDASLQGDSPVVWFDRTRVYYARLTLDARAQPPVAGRQDRIKEWSSRLFGIKRSPKSSTTVER